MMMDHPQMTTVPEQRLKAASIEERIVTSLEVIARGLELIRAHLEEQGAESPAAGATSGPWLRRVPSP